MVKEKGKTVVIEEYWDEDGTYLVKVDGKFVPYDSTLRPYVKVAEIDNG